jgi:hypothetical protein
LPSPVRISAIWPSWSTMPPISCTSKWRIAIVRRPTSRVSANDSDRHVVERLALLLHAALELANCSLSSSSSSSSSSASQR